MSKDTTNENATAQTCPHCGYCPHCGRANPPVGVLPWPIYPRPYRPYWQIPSPNQITYTATAIDQPGVYMNAVSN